MWLSHDIGYEIMRRDFIFAVKQFSELVINKKFDIVHDDFHDDMITRSIVQQSPTTAICYQTI